MCRDKKLNCGGPPPGRALVKMLNNYLNVVSDGSLCPVQAGFCRAAGCCRKACLCTFELSGRTQSCIPHARADPYLLEFNLINFAYIETSVMPRKASFEERKIIFAVRVCVPEVLEEVGISDARLRGVSLPESCSSLNGAVAVPKIGSRVLPLTAWEKESNPYNPLFPFSFFLSGPVKGP